ncbi:hypothetical protein ISI02_26480 [Burkholderia pseudomallei]|nr:hypothetical protein [Burkholderia pseudomallei]
MASKLAWLGGGAVASLAATNIDPILARSDEMPGCYFPSPKRTSAYIERRS